MKDTLGVLLAGGAGERLFPLTRDRAKPAVPFGGNYRIIDITLSNCINSGLRRVYILTQYKALSLNRHIREGWTSVVAQELGEFIEILSPMQRVSANWYMGTADAVYQNIYSIGAEQPKHVIILSGDHIYKMDYGKMLEHHQATNADVTLATLPIEPHEVSRFGVVEIERSGEVIGFQEKPKTTNLRSPFNPNMVDASMGIYLFNTDVLLPALMQDAEDPTSKHDFGHNILPSILGKYKIQAYNFVDENKQHALYWRDVGTLDAYYDANMDIASVSPVFNLYDAHWPMRTRVRQYPPAKFVFGEPGRTGMAVNSIVSAGCIVSGAVVRNSVLSQDVRVNSYSEVDSSIVFSHVDIGRHCRIRRAIIDRDVHLPEGTVIGYDQNEDKKNYFVTPSGLTVVTRDHSLYENPVASDFLQQG
ncbi:glucose-1-phosphate adenylyltransferase [Silvibacterium dinghuense]|uniref:Glucose-1-phosphate adenylyltransferase n=2 Tax=Silvibacterium dinghuense TaxID=1560006 RepID=A0A4Q1SIF2_9BACT|nr:glucose-1-phosphate adenylyltransferase [Silvibacterium dinghuense]GGG98567.1 glucose-1-phosphate adenylyltransferase [Silvibacterium dinghuense]